MRKFKWLWLAGAGMASAAASPAWAGEEVIYADAPEWVEPVDLDGVERDRANSQVINDTQIWIEEGQLWQYNEIVYRVATVADLGNVGTLTARWLPDKGDLIVHDVAIFRDGEIVDILENGAEFEVLRRERNLEHRIIDGSLTATMAVPGLEVGDELRLRYTVTKSDQALGDEVQSQTLLWREPSQLADFARVRASWSEDVNVHFRAGPNFELPDLERSDGMVEIEVMLPLEKAEEFPFDAPLRYRRGTVLQLGTFSGWAEVSSTMAPHYETDGALDGIDDLLAKVEAIRADYSTDLERAVAALELVQEDIRYLLNGLDGGNYLPQDVATTWANKYGDCKAKTVILLAILDHLDIAAEPVLVSSDAGNVVPISLPIPGAFDHVLVRANIGGNLYYLDGTSMGANIAIIGNVPAFEFALPIRASGAELEPIVQVLPRVPELAFELTIDASAGADLPTLATMNFHALGTFAAQVNAMAEKLNDENKKTLARRLGQEMQLLDVEILPGQDDSEATLILTGLMSEVFSFEGDRGELELNIMADSIAFAPDRSRHDWRDIPVAIGAANAIKMQVKTILPEYAKGYQVQGGEPVNIEVARRRYVRGIEFDDRVLTISEIVTSLGGEVAPEAFREERRKSAALARKEAKVVAPEGLARRWRFAMGKDRSVLEPLEKAYAKIIANEPDEYEPYLSRAAFRYDVYDFRGSLEDMNSVVELEATAEYYGQRATVHSQLLDIHAYLADLEEAYALDPSPGRAINLAEGLAEAGDTVRAREILEYHEGDENVQKSLTIALAELDAMEGRPDAGFARIEDFIETFSNETETLNDKCWYMATWQIDVSEGVSLCTKAVENSDNAASVLDSRALMFLRNDMLDQAMIDIDSALELNPDQTASVLLKGLIMRARGDERAEAQIDEALARSPSLARSYRRWGFDL